MEVANMSVLDGEMCLKVRCSKCCWDTQMILTPSDIQRIEKLGYKREYFAFFDGKYWRLKNVNGHCIFLDEKTGLCKIYENRPLGCRAYPIIVDDETNMCVIDIEYCPLAEKITVKEYLLGCRILQKIFRELGEKEPKPIGIQ